MVNVTVISSSPAVVSTTARLAEHVRERLVSAGFTACHVRLRDLPPAALLAADTSDPAVVNVVSQIERSRGIVLATPTFKAAYSGLLKVFLDLLPQYGLAGKIVLPLATGGTLAHVLALDYGLRPVLQSMMPRHVVQSHFVQSAHMSAAGDTPFLPEHNPQLLDASIAAFCDALDGSLPLATAA
jgi:FMN reductase